MRHIARRSMTGAIEIVDSEFDFVRAILPYNYAYTSNAQQWNEAERICQALEGPMSAGGIVTAEPAPNTKTDQGAGR
jgi:hypothetical protein